MVGGAVFTHDTAAINGKDHWQGLDTHIVNNLIVSPLQKKSSKWPPPA